MSTPQTEEIFFSILSSLLSLPRDQLNLESSRDTIEKWDSLKHIHLILALEEEFEIEFDDVEISELSSANTMLDSIHSKQNN